MLRRDWTKSDLQDVYDVADAVCLMTNDENGKEARKKTEGKSNSTI